MPSCPSKQKSLHSASPVRDFGFLWILLCLSCTSAPVVPANAQAAPAKSLSPGYGDTTSTLRLIAAPARRDGAYDVAVDIAMSKGSHTYWKQPGESGVPPVFSFNGSDNVRQAEVAYPIPSRITEEGLTAYGYTDRVAFPVRVTPVDASKPSVLHADVTYAVCNKICVPAHGEAKLMLPVHGDGGSGAIVDAALAKVPRPADEAQRHDLAITRRNGVAPPTWTLAWHGKAPVADIFVDAPEGFFFSTRKDGDNAWTLVADQTVPGALARHVPVALTLARGDASIVVTEPLDAGAPAK